MSEDNITDHRDHREELREAALELADMKLAIRSDAIGGAFGTFLFLLGEWSGWGIIISLIGILIFARFAHIAMTERAGFTTYLIGIPAAIFIAAGAYFKLLEIQF